MKKYISSVLFVFCLVSCKKDNTNDISGLFSNTNWVGELKYDNQPWPEPFSISFGGNGTLIWNQRSGEYSGTYSLDRKNDITINFGQGNSFTASVSDNKKFTNVRHNNAIGWKILYGELNSDPDMSLDNTTWGGQIIYLPGSAPRTIEVYFYPGSKVSTIIQGGGGGFESFTRRNASIRGDFRYFAVLSNGRLIGLYHNNTNSQESWTATKK